MCRECYQSPCVPGCPNFVPKPVYTCEFCGESIFEGDKYVEFDGVPYHPECIEDIAYRLLRENFPVEDKIARR